MEKEIKIIHRKLGQERAHGQAFQDDRIIEIDSRLVGKKHLEVLIHELHHVLNPDFSETKIDQQAKEFAKYLWKQKYRKIDDRIKQPSI